MKILVVLGILILLGLGIFLFILKPEGKSEINIIPSTKKVVSFKASFAIFTNGTFRIFTDSKYHGKSPDAFMDEANIVIVKKNGTTWADFFNTLPMTLNKDCIITGTGQTFCTNNTSRLRFFINGSEEPNALDKEIKENDKLLITYGNETESQIKLQQEQIPNP